MAINEAVARTSTGQLTEAHDGALIVSGPSSIARTSRAGLQPAIAADGLLGDEGEHRVSSAEGDDRGLAEKEPLLDNDVLPADKERQRGQGAEPQRQADPQNDGGPASRRACVREQAARHHRVDQGSPRFLGADRPRPGEQFRPKPRSEQTEGRRAGDDGGIGDAQGEDRQEGRRRHGQHQPTLDGPGVQEPGVADPPAPIDEFAMHERNLPGRAAEAQ
jgi:hypothetical protein